uniref:THAP domain-containing protein 8 n=1 Tax=Chrysemys picta bellii TaxID=8478 RepID=A0A8C3F416_CHRPI
MPKYCRAPNCSNSAGPRRPGGERLSFYRSVPPARRRDVRARHAPVRDVTRGALSAAPPSGQRGLATGGERPSPRGAGL